MLPLRGSPAELSTYIPCTSSGRSAWLCFSNDSVRLILLQDQSLCLRANGSPLAQMLRPLRPLFDALARASVLLVAPSRPLLLQLVKPPLVGTLQLRIRQKLLGDRLLSLLVAQAACATRPAPDSALRKLAILRGQTPHGSQLHPQQSCTVG